MGGNRMDSPGSGHGKVLSLHEHSNKPSGSIKWRALLD